MDHVFGIFSPARNYHLGVTTDREAQEWVDLIRAEARIDERSSKWPTPNHAIEVFVSQSTDETRLR